MNGPQHYQEAERLLNLGDEMGRDNGEAETLLVQHAQVHATLALAAATALAPSLSESGSPDYADYRAWAKASGVELAPKDGAA